MRYRVQQNLMNPDLRLRILPAILYVITIAICTLLGPVTALVLIQVFAILCYYEFIQKSLPAETQNTSEAGKLLVIVIAISALCINLLKSPFIWNLLMGLTAILFIINSYFIIINHTSFFNKGNIVSRAMTYLALPFLTTSYLLLNQEGFHEILLGIFIILWLNDAGAYFVGKAIGKHKISPKVSPGKSWEGWIGGIVIGALSTLIITKYLTVMDQKDWLILAVIIGVTGLIGDLVESSWKRHLGIKDSGTLMPGHGGFLDRLDSFIYCIPFVALYILHF